MAAPSRPDNAGSALLAELRQAAEAASAREAADLHARHERQQAIGRRMRQLFNYLAEFCRHLDTLHPPIPASFRLTPGALLDGLAWQESFMDYRTESSSELAPINAVTCRYTLQGPGTVTAFRGVAQKDAYRDELTRYGLRYTEHPRRDAHGLIEEVAFEVNREIRVWLRFTPEFDAGRIDVETRNFKGLGPARFHFSADTLDTPLLENLGQHILGRPSGLFEFWQPDLTRL